MTARKLYEDLLIELNKRKVQSLLREDFIYFVNKTILQYINDIYSIFEIDQKRADDLRVLRSTSILTPGLSTNYTSHSLLNKTYEVKLPDDYLHILGCIVEYTLSKSYMCYNTGDKFQVGAIRLTSDMFPAIMSDYYHKPKYNRPYYFINNVASDINYPINENLSSVNTDGTILNSLTITFGTPGTSSISIVKDNVTYTFTYSATEEGDLYFSNISSLSVALANIGITSTIGEGENNNELTLSNTYIEGVTDSWVTGTYLTIALAGSTDSGFVNRLSGFRYGNKSKVRMEIRYGNNNTTFVPTKVYVDYFRSPQYIDLTEEQLDSVEDTSQILEFPDYVCQEILNKLIIFIMENSENPRLQTNIPVNQPIAGQQKR